MVNRLPVATRAPLSLVGLARTFFVAREKYFCWMYYSGLISFQAAVYILSTARLIAVAVTRGMAFGILLKPLVRAFRPSYFMLKWGSEGSFYSSFGPFLAHL